MFLIPFSAFHLQTLCSDPKRPGMGGTNLLTYCDEYIVLRADSNNRFGRISTEESPPFGFGEVEKEFQELVPQLQKFDPRWRKRFKNHVTEEREQDGAGEQNTERCLSKSCVVVGSSNKLLGSNLGSAIDAHDVVIRFNAAPTHPRSVN